MLWLSFRRSYSSLFVRLLAHFSSITWITFLLSKTGGDKRFIGEGTFVGWSGVKLERDYDDGAGRRALNNISAVEYFRYRPDFITAAPEEFMRSRYSWQQVNP